MMTTDRVALNLVTLKGEHDAKHLLQKVKSAAKAGFRGVGIWAEDAEAWLGAGKRLRDLHHAVTDQGMKVVELCEVTVCDEHGARGGPDPRIRRGGRAGRAAGRGGL